MTTANVISKFAFAELSCDYFVIITSSLEFDNVGEERYKRTLRSAVQANTGD